MARLRWTPSELRKLSRMLNDGYTVNMIAEAFNTSHGAIAAVMARSGFKSKRQEVAITLHAAAYLLGIDFYSLKHWISNGELADIQQAKNHTHTILPSKLLDLLKHHPYEVTHWSLVKDAYFRSELRELQADLLTREEVADMLCVTSSAVGKLKLPYFKLGYRQYYERRVILAVQSQRAVQRRRSTH